MFKLLRGKEAVNANAIPEGMTLEQLRVEMLNLMAQENTNHYRMGQFYNFLVEKKLAEKAGFKDAKAYVSKHLADLSQSALSMYGAVADAFSETVSRRFGITCLYLLLIYKEAADVQVNHEEPGPTLIEVPRDDGQVDSKPFSACSVDQMRKALQRKRKPASSKPLPADAVVRAEQYREAVKGRFPKGVLVKVLVRNQKGTAVLDFKGIPVDQVDHLVDVLTGELPPVPQVFEK
jgi:hypothetical protein